MKGRKIICFLLLTGTILTAASCRKEFMPEGDGYCRIVLSLNSSHALRMETKTVADDLLDGSRFSNLLVILTDNSGKVVSKFYKDDYASPQTQDEIEFDNLLPGNYHAYAYANIDATQWQQTGANVISSKEGALNAGNSFTFIDRELLGLTTAGRDAPVSPVTSMLLTGKLDISVGLSVEEAELDLIRPVVRFKVTVRNNTPFPVSVDALSFSNFNPDRAYLLDHLNASGVPLVPDGVTYRELPAFDPSSLLATVASHDTSVVYTTYLYENVAPDTYKIFTTVTIDRSGESLDDLSLMIDGRTPFSSIDLAALNAMEDGESVDVLIVNPRKTTRAGRLFYGIGDTNIAWESCGYQYFDDFRKRALAIYKESSAHTYKGFKYTGFGNNDSGLAKWTGNDGDAPVMYTDPSTNEVVFNYSGARSTHFKRLTKQGGKYSITGLTTDPPGGSSITDLRIVAGKIISGRFPDDIQARYLLQFIKDNTSDANNGKYLKASSAYGASTLDAAKVCPLSWESAGQSEHDHQFVLFGYLNDQGAALKRILKENHKEVPLTYMARNEEINVIVNVFYADQEGSLTFEVDNDHWTDDHATESEHTFN